MATICYLCPMNRGKFWILSMSGIVLAASCSTDVELNAPYDSRTVVYALLEASADTQFFRINKTFLGDGNNLDYAAVRDSSEYDPSELYARVEQWSGGNLQNTFDLNPIDRSDKETNGIFFAPEFTAYYFPTPNGLDDESSYRLLIDFNNGEEPIRSETDMVESLNGNANITRPPSNNPSFRLILATAQTALTGVYPEFRFKWNSTPGAGRYDAVLRMHYIERLWEDQAHTILVSETPKVFEWNIGTYQTKSLLGGEEFEAITNGETFFRLIGSSIAANPLITRQIGTVSGQNNPTFDFILSVANGELDTYMEVNSPVTGIIQERPAYTNIVNGLGIFASKATQGVYGFQPHEETIRELWSGPYTSTLNFCSPDPLFQTEGFYCD